MMAPLKSTVLNLLKVPPEPAIPAGSPGSKRTFRAAENYYKLKLFLWGFGQLSGLVGIVVFLWIWHSMAGEVPRKVHLTVDVLKIVGIVMFVIQIPFTFAMVRLDYELRWYIATDRSLRIRAGLWEVREMTLTFANIQQISVHQGPLQRWLGIYDLEVSTAGGGASARSGHPGVRQTNDTHQGFFHGIDNAPEVRDLILERLRRLRDTGLGDPDETSHDEPDNDPVESQLIESARDLLREAKALRQAVA